MSTHTPLRLDTEQCVQHIVKLFGQDIRIGMPLGLGKPVPLINALYQRAKRDRSIRLTIFTALSLEKPRWSNELERRFLQPFVERVWAGVPDLDYLSDLRSGELPDNVRLHELFFKAGGYKGSARMQMDHLCSNYTHVVRDCSSNDNAIFAHMLASRDSDGRTHYSASCNADTTLQTLQTFARDLAAGRKRLRIGMVNRHLPFMYGDAEVDASQYDILIDAPEGHHPLFSTPRLPVSDGDHCIGLHTSALIRDGGTLQIGIGALGDAIASALNLRHNHNAVYREALEATGLPARQGALIKAIGGLGIFEQGLYGSTEMLVDAFVQLDKAGVMRRAVYRHAGLQALVNQGSVQPPAVPPDLLDRLLAQELLPPYLTRREFEVLQHHGVFADDVRYEEGWLLRGDRRHSALLTDKARRRALASDCLGSTLRNGVVLTGGFFIGPRDFYDVLRGMSETERQRFEMTGVEVANQLYGNETLRALQRKDARFCNTGMKATLLGHIVSDGLEDGSVISGVGGQYNFVAMAHALPDARLLMMIKSTRSEGGQTLSNIVFNHGHVTIPRHLRDIVITEYGVADLRGRCDQDIVKALLNVADSRFQDELMQQAKRQHKLPPDYEIPLAYRQNTPERLAALLKPFKALGQFGPFPFGSEFTREEMVLAHALKLLKARTAGGMDAALQDQLGSLPATAPPHAVPLLARMGLGEAATAADQPLHRMVMLALRLAGVV